MVDDPHICWKEPVNDLEKLLDDRIDGVRGMYQFDLDEADPDYVPPAVSFQHRDITVVVVPTLTDDGIALDIHGFADGETVGAPFHRLYH